MPRPPPAPDRASPAKRGARRRQRRLHLSRRRLEISLVRRLHEARLRAGGNRLHRLVVVALDRVAERVRALAGGYQPPTFEHVPDPDAALFLCAVDHRTGYRARYLVGGRGPFEGSALMWELGLRAARRERGLLTAARLVDVGAGRGAEIFRSGAGTVDDAERRAARGSDLARGLAD